MRSQSDMGYMLPRGSPVLRRLSTAGHGLIEFARRKPLGAVGAAIVLILIFVALLAPFIAPEDPLSVNTSEVFTPPGRDFLLGSDQIGRDVLSRLIYGTRISLYVGIVSVLIGTSIGTLVGLVSGYFGGIGHLLIHRLLEALMSFPGIIMALAMSAGLGSSLENVIIALVIVFTPGAARTIRSRVLTLKELDFVLASRAIGAGDWRICLRHILPNCLSLYIVFCTINVGFAIILEASLSFLGLGAPPEVPSWGGMLTKAASTHIDLAPWLAILPGIAVALLVFGFNMLGDALRDVLDPRLRGT